MIENQTVVYKNKNGIGFEKDINDGKNSHYTLTLRCDECAATWTTYVGNWRSKKQKTPDRLDLCSHCIKKGERNPSYGRDRSEVLSYARQFQKRNGMKGNHHSIAAREKMSLRKVEAIANGTFDILSNNRGQKSWYTSSKTKEMLHADSFLEVCRMKELDEDASVLKWTKRHGIRIEYQYEGVVRHYVPDFLITLTTGDIVIEEVKGRVLDVDNIKEQAAIRYCKQHGFKYQRKMMKDIKNYKQQLRERVTCT